MRKVQEIFNLAIQMEMYPHQSDYMCVVLSAMLEADHITVSEYTMVTNEITDYIHIADTDSLEEALEFSKLPYYEEDRIKLYLDWENRPQLTEYELWDDGYEDALEDAIQ